MCDRLRWVAVAGLLGAIAPAQADDHADDPAVAAAKKDKKKAKAKAERQKGSTVEVHGRVFARAAAASEENALGTAPWTGALTLASARIGVDYQWREQLRAKVSFEAAKGSLRDAFVELPLGHGLRVRAGRMKLPVGALEQTSAWTLPTIDRGMAADVLADGLGLTGRRSAIELRWRGAGTGRPTLTLALGQGVRLAGGEQPAPLADGGGITAVARASVEPCTMYSVAVVGVSRVVNYGSATARFWSASVEAEVDLSAIGHGLRLWGDATYGTSPLGVAAVGDADRPFAVAEVTAGYRFGGRDNGSAYVEPYLSAGYVNPIADRRRDDTAAVVVGVAGGLWKRWRAQGQYTYQNAKALRPAGLLGTADINDGQAIALQLGAAF